MKHKGQNQRQNSMPDAASQLRSKASPRQGKNTKSATVSDLKPGVEIPSQPEQPDKSATSAHLESAPKVSRNHQLPPRRLDREAKVDVDIPGSFLSSSYEPIYLVRFVFGAIASAGAWRWASVLQRLAKTLSPVDLERARMGLMEMALEAERVDSDLEEWESNSEKPLEDFPTHPKTGLGQWSDPTFEAVMLEFCCHLHDWREAICDEIEASPKDWDSGEAAIDTKSVRLTLAEALMVAELWLSREGISTGLEGQPSYYMERKPTRVQALAHRLRQDLYTDAFNVKARKEGCLGIGDPDKAGKAGKAAV